jgi:hypothetical protein
MFAMRIIMLAVALGAIAGCSEAEPEECPTCGKGGAGTAGNSMLVKSHYSARQFHPANGELRRCHDYLAREPANAVEAQKQSNFLNMTVSSSEAACLSAFEIFDEPCPLQDDLAFACVVMEVDRVPRTARGQFSRTDQYWYGANRCVRSGEETEPYREDYIDALSRTCASGGFGRQGVSGAQLLSGEVVPPTVEQWLE